MFQACAPDKADALLAAASSSFELPNALLGCCLILLLVGWMRDKQVLHEQHVREILVVFREKMPYY